MTVFEKIKSKNIDELAEWLDKYCIYDGAPWVNFWDINYCEKCESIELSNSLGYNTDYAYCEVNGHCKFFKELKDVPSTKQLIKMWLESESN